MSVDAVRRICRSFPEVTEDVKWGNDLVFSVGGKMFAVVDLEPPYSVAFKCSAESFGELIERPGIIPAPYLARAMWVQETEFGEALDLGFTGAGHAPRRGVRRRGRRTSEVQTTWRRIAGEESGG